MEESEGGRCDSPVYPCPSFNSYSACGLADVANRVCREEEEEAAAAAMGPKWGLVSADFSEQDHRDRLDHGGSYDDEDDDFEFVPLVKNSDQVFIGRYAGPVFPVFNRDLMSGGGDRETVRGEEEEEEESERSIRSPLKNLFLEDANQPSCSSSEADELESVPEGTYCVWTPRSPTAEQSPARCKKSNSTGSCSKRWRFRDLLRRSNSEGKDSFGFLAPSSSSAPKAAAGGTGFREKISSSGEAIAAAAAARTGKSKAAKEKASASAHETFYVRNRALKEGDRRRSYLPYRKDLVGFFANVNDIGRRFPPF